MDPLQLAQQNRGSDPDPDIGPLQFLPLKSKE
jgi:hypothetical protein